MANRIDTQPKADGFRMPGEFEAHEAVWMAWPQRSDNWRNGGQPAQACFTKVAEAIARKTPVIMAVNADQYENARQMLPNHIKVVEMSTNDSWMRDMGPSYVVNDKGQRRGVDWEFNAWGGLVDGLYFPWDKDDQVAQKICQFHGDDSYRVSIVLEGGSIHVDGEGTLYTTEECLLHESRNPDLNRTEIEDVLKNALSVEKVIWLKDGLCNDETNGHVDNLIHVGPEGHIFLTWSDDEQDPVYGICRSAFDVLSTGRDARGRDLTIHKLPLPGPLYIREDEADGIDLCDGMAREVGERLSGSYANFLISNGQIIMPLLDEATDQEARDVLQAAFPDYEVIGIEAREILLGGGNIHCITQQIPAV